MPPVGLRAGGLFRVRAHARVAAALLSKVRRSRLAPALCALVVGVALIGGITYYGSRVFTRRAAQIRASNEAASLSAHSAYLATGEAFDGYIQILRYADDPAVFDPQASPRARAVALRRFVDLSTNKFDSLTIADRSGKAIAATDATVASVADSPAFVETMRLSTATNSGVTLPTAGAPGFVDYAVPLRDAGGVIWGALLGRANPDRFWRSTLKASVDGSRNVIINADGEFAGGVPVDALKQPWRGSAVGTDGVRAQIAGVDSICGLSAIGKDTQIDRGLDVASCLPTSIIQVEQQRAVGKQGLLTLAASVLIIVVAAGALRGFAPRRRGGEAGGPTAEPASTLDDVDSGMESLFAASAPLLEEPAPLTDAPEPPADPFDAHPGGADTPAPPLLAADVDAVTLIESYEQRNERLAQMLRESLQAKLLTATSQADEAYRLANTDVELASKLHGYALAQLEEVREHDLRAIGQELHPGLVRIGLAGALRGLRKELGDIIDIRLDLDPTADSVDGDNGRPSVPSVLRVAAYRFALEAARALARSDARECTCSLRRLPGSVMLELSGAAAPESIESLRAAMAPYAIAAASYGGGLDVGVRDGRVTLSIWFPGAGPSAPLPEAAEPDSTFAEREVAPVL